MSVRGPLALCVLLLLSFGSLNELSAQTTGSAAGSTPGASGASTPSASTTLQPVPYSPDEFPQWARDLRRAEIITIGVFPFAYFYTNAMYDLGRYLVLTIAGNPNAGNYAPWFFAPPTKPQLTDGEKVGILVGSIAVAALVAALDYTLGKAYEKSSVKSGASGR
ncbi:hypothetical protein [Salinispira pacifica]